MIGEGIGEGEELRRDNPEDVEAHKESIESVIRNNIDFWWDSRNSPLETWAGFNKEALKDLTVQIGTIIGITADQAQKIKIIFGDHIVVEKEGEPDVINEGCSITDYDAEDKVEKIRVIINRSLEIARRNAQKSLAEEHDEDEINCIFKSPLECIVWIIAEELKHAQINIILASKEAIDKAENKYREYIRNKRLNFKDEYASDIAEVAVSRVTVTVLARMFKNISPERSDYFTELYKKSLTARRHISPNFREVIEKTFVPTHFVT